MKSARIDFGIPDSEYILEVDDSGAATSLVNQDTDTEYVGGGSSDFSTAEVTIVNNTESMPDLYDAPICVEENALSEGSPACVVARLPIDSGVYKVPLYKGTCVWFEFYDLFEGATISLSGDLTNISNSLVITGDGTITIS